VRTRALRFGALPLLLAACSTGVGEGERPVDFYLATPNSTESFGLSECSTGAVQAIVMFDGSGGVQLGDYTARSSWQSDAPDVVAVDNNGNLIAKAPGVATISAKYLEFTASASVVVVPIEQLYITPTLTDLAADVDQAYTLYAVFADSPVPVDITTDAHWDLNGESVRAYVDAGTGVVHAGAASSGAPIQLFAQLPACGRSAQTEFQVSTLQALRLEYEFPPPQNLPVGISEKVRVWGSFGDAMHTEQNLSRQVTLRNEAGSAILPFVGTDSLILQAVELASSATVTLGLYDFALSAQTAPMNFVTDPLVDVTVSPENIFVTYPATGQLEATGTFASGLTVPITRHVTWVSGDESVLTVDPSLDAAGTVHVANVNQNVQVRAIAPSATGDGEDQAQVLIFAE
jgi:hypothetical protein